LRKFVKEKHEFNYYQISASKIRYRAMLGAPRDSKIRKSEARERRETLGESDAFFFHLYNNNIM